MFITKAIKTKKHERKEDLRLSPTALKKQGWNNLLEPTSPPRYLYREMFHAKSEQVFPAVPIDRSLGFSVGLRSCGNLKILHKIPETYFSPPPSLWLCSLEAGVHAPHKFF